MAAEEAIYTALQSLVDGRCHAGLMPQSVTLPAIFIERETASREGTLNQSVTLSNPRIRITCWAETLAGARTLAASVKAAMKTAGVVNQIEDDSFERDPETLLPGVTLTYSCWETE